MPMCFLIIGIKHVKPLIVHCNVRISYIFQPTFFLKLKDRINYFYHFSLKLNFWCTGPKLFNLEYSYKHLVEWSITLKGIQWWVVNPANVIHYLPLDRFAYVECFISFLSWESWVRMENPEHVTLWATKLLLSLHFPFDLLYLVVFALVPNESYRHLSFVFYAPSFCNNIFGLPRLSPTNF